MNRPKILLITGAPTKLTYYNHYINYFKRKKDLLYYNTNLRCGAKEFCKQKGFSPDVILFDHYYADQFIFKDNIQSDLLAGLDGCIKILHSHKDMYPVTMRKIKSFCDQFNIKNLFHINAKIFDEVTALGEFTDQKRNQKINFDDFYSGLNYHPIEYGFEQSTFGDIDCVVEKTECLNYAGVVGNHPEDSPLGMRKDFLNLASKICERNDFSYHFLRDKKHRNTEDYSRSMLRSRITIDTPTIGGHISARLFEIPLHKSAIMVFEDEIYNDILEDGVDSIIIKRDFSDLEERLRFYLTDNEGKLSLEKIIDNAYHKFNDKHTIINRLEYMLKLSGVCDTKLVYEDI